MIKTCKPEWLMADIIAECPEVPVALAQQSLMRTVRQFSTTCMLAVWVDIPTQKDVQHYPFERYLPEGYGVKYVEDVKYNGCCIRCLDDDCNQMCTSGYTLDDMKQITLKGYCPQTDDSMPDCKDTLEVKAVLQPNRDACEIPCDMLEQFEDELKAGTMSKLLGMKNKAWSDGKLADYYENQFLGGLASAKCLVQNKMSTKQMVMEPERLC